MPAAPPRQGDVVWLTVADPNGFRKRRPAVVVSTEVDVAGQKGVAAVAVTTSFTDPPPPAHLELPWDPFGRSSTRLRRRSAAVCNWIVVAAHTDVEATGGYVPPPILLEILKNLPASGPTP